MSDDLLRQLTRARAEIDALRKRNEELRQQAAEHRATIAELRQQLANATDQPTRRP